MNFLNKFKLEYLLLFLWVGSLLAINSISLDLINFHKTESNISLDFFFIFINYIRFLLPFIILPILVGILIFKKNYKFNLNKAKVIKTGK